MIPFVSRPRKRYRSAGILITREVRDAIYRGDAARDNKVWQEAACHYDEALRNDGSLTHIWIQRGHAAKEMGAIAEAEACYLAAEKLAPGKAETQLHLGHIRKLENRFVDAAKYYLEAFRRDPKDPNIFSELHQLLARGNGDVQKQAAYLLRESINQIPILDAAINTKRSALRNLMRLGRRAAQPSPFSVAAPRKRIGEAGPCFVFDVSDLVAYFNHVRLPTGIQRVQTEVIADLLRSVGRHDIQICCFIDGREDWLELAPNAFLELAEASVASDDRSDPAWMMMLNQLYLKLRGSPAFIFPKDAFLINLGTSWWMQNYFLYVREAKRRFGVKYIPLVYDLIPVLAPEHCLPHLTQSFISWLIGVASHADHYLTISEATRSDLIGTLRQIGQTIDPHKVVPIPLDAAFARKVSAGARRETLRKVNLKAAGFVLLVSTVESRKGHRLAFTAWRTLMDLHGEEAVPILACVGRNGWLNDDVYRELREDARLSRKVRMIPGMSDEQLGALYDSCLFTLYPSSYEGWGLPVTESLCRGKAVVASRSSSIPEAGGKFADYFKPGDVIDLVERLNSLVFDKGYRRAREKAILEEFRPRSWATIGEQIFTTVAQWRATPRSNNVQAPLARVGLFYPLSHSIALRIWPGIGCGEMFRSGTGWWWPDDEGCWTKEGGGELRFTREDLSQTIRLFILLRGLPNRPTDWIVYHADGLLAKQGRLDAYERKWIWVDDLVTNDQREIAVTIMGSVCVEADIEIGAGRALRSICVGCCGFAVGKVAKDGEDTLGDQLLYDHNELNAFAEHRAKGGIAGNFE